MSLNGKEIYIGNPTVVPFKYFNVAEDVRMLRESMKGFGTDEMGLISIITRRSNKQLQLIQRAYQKILNRNLYDDVRSETSGNFRKLLCALLMPRLRFYVEQLYHAFHGIWTDVDAVVEILVSLTHKEIVAVRECYSKDYDCSLEIDITTDTSGQLCSLLLALCQVRRDTAMANHALAQKDAEELLAYKKTKHKSNEEMIFHRILTRRSFSHIRAINRAIETTGSNDLTKLVYKHFSGDHLKALSAIVSFAMSPAQFFASRLHMSMTGLGTNDSRLIRVTVMRCEIDLADVDINFGFNYGKTLNSYIKGDTSGDYEQTLLKLIRHS